MRVKSFFSILTDESGTATLTLNYLPYGEDWVDVQNYVDTRYLVWESMDSTGKERDTETGYGYFGARYMDNELLTGWMSVDPMADKYPGISPYAYCVWNPIKLVDPDGREIDPSSMNAFSKAKKDIRKRIDHYQTIIKNANVKIDKLQSKGETKKNR